MYDVIIIGTGMSGATSARRLSRYKVNACVLEQEEDVCCGTSKANSAIVHAGYDAAEGSLITGLNVGGDQTIPELAKELDFPFNPCGSFVVCLDEEFLPDLRALHRRGVKNGVEDLEIITGKARIRGIEPSLADEAAGVLYAPTAGIAYPFNLNIVLAENTYTNGVGFKFNTEVTDIRRIGGERALGTNQGVYETRCVVNAAEVHVDKFHNMAGGAEIRITPRRGNYYLLDKDAGNHVNHTIFALPGKYGKGVLVSPTTYDNLIVGPTTIDIKDKEVTTTTREGLNELIAKTRTDVKDLPIRQAITSFTGFRTRGGHREFIIKELEGAPGLVDCAEIESPGLTSCSAIGRMVAGILKEKPELEPDLQFDDSHRRVLDPDILTEEEQAKLIKQSPAYGNIICRCKMVTEEEILGAIHKPLRTHSLDGIKRRIRVGMGRCQVGFCTPRFMGLLHRGLGLPMTGITKAGGDSKLVVGTNKDRTQRGTRTR